jgi:hypothetical protein
MVRKSPRKKTKKQRYYDGGYDFAQAIGFNIGMLHRIRKDRIKAIQNALQKPYVINEADAEYIFTYCPNIFDNMHLNSFFPPKDLTQDKIIQENFEALLATQEEVSQLCEDYVGVKEILSVFARNLNASGEPKYLRSDMKKLRDDLELVQLRNASSTGTDRHFLVFSKGLNKRADEDNI